MSPIYGPTERASLTSRLVFTSCLHDENQPSCFHKQHLNGFPQLIYFITQSKIIFGQANFRSVTSR